MKPHKSKKREKSKTEKQEILTKEDFLSVLDRVIRPVVKPSRGKEKKETSE